MAEGSEGSRLRRGRGIRGMGLAGVYRQAERLPADARRRGGRCGQRGRRDPGEIRKTSVTVGPYRQPLAEDCEYLLDRLCSSLKIEFERADVFDPISKSVLLAVWAHLYIAWIHPFGDGNGRTARLVGFTLLLEGGVPAPAAHLLSNHNNRTRSSYYMELDKASHYQEVPPIVLRCGIKGRIRY